MPLDSLLHPTVASKTSKMPLIGFLYAPFSEDGVEAYFLSLSEQEGFG